MSQTRGTAFLNLINFPSVIEKVILGNVENQSVFMLILLVNLIRFNQYFDVFFWGGVIVYFQNT